MNDVHIDFIYEEAEPILEVNPYQDIENEILDCIYEQDISSYQLRKSFCAALGDEPQEIEEDLKDFTQSLRTYFDNEFPINRISQIISQVEIFENGKIVFQKALIERGFPVKILHQLIDVVEKKQESILDITFPNIENGFVESIPLDGDFLELDENTAFLSLMDIIETLYDYGDAESIQVSLRKKE